VIPSDDATLIDRLTFSPDPIECHIDPLPFPPELTPTVVLDTPVTAGDVLPHADVLVVTWTKAEWEALADVLTPGVETGSWGTYTENWDAFEPHLTWKSPAKEAKCLGQGQMTRIGDRYVLAFHSELHLATDDDSAPVIALWQQIIREVQPSLIITTGTAGGIGMSTVLGDVFVCANAKFNCTKMFKHEKWAQQGFTSVEDAMAYPLHPSLADLVPINAPKLQPIATRDPVVTQGGDVETVDYFGFDDTDDSYHIVSNDPEAHTEEMDDATLWQAIAEMSWDDGLSEPQTLSVRNASDPEVPSSIGTLEEQSKWASHIYEKYGYWTTIVSALTVWALIAGGQ
jgi:nucleoside phosphorylase